VKKLLASILIGCMVFSTSLAITGCGGDKDKDKKDKKKDDEEKKKKKED
jgi:hypothetical protein